MAAGIAAVQKGIKKIVLAYSGGLDTSVILHWLREQTGAEVVAFAADLGQGGELARASKNADKLGAKLCVADLGEEFVKDYVFAALRANAVYEGFYLLGTAIARPIIAAKQVELAHELKADAVAHGATGKGNDQIRFELAYAALDPNLKVLAPWRHWRLKSRSQLLAYAQERLPIDDFSAADPPYSTDANLLHVSYEGKDLEDPWRPPPPNMFRLTVSPQKAPDKTEELTIGFRGGDPISINGEKFSAAGILQRLNEVAGAAGIGRVDIVENRFIGIKSRGVYETPGGTVLSVARRALESITLERGAAHLKDSLMPRYAELVYNGFWFTPQRRMLQAAIDEQSGVVNGEVRVGLYKGNVTILGRRSPNSLYREELATFEAEDVFSPIDSEGFIKLQSLSLRGQGKK